MVVVGTAAAVADVAREPVGQVVAVGIGRDGLLVAPVAVALVPGTVQGGQRVVVVGIGVVGAPVDDAFVGRAVAAVAGMVTRF